MKKNVKNSIIPKLFMYDLLHDIIKKATSKIFVQHRRKKLQKHIKNILENGTIIIK